jgi:hypothetical protein
MKNKVINHGVVMNFIRLNSQDTQEKDHGNFHLHKIYKTGDVLLIGALIIITNTFYALFFDQNITGWRNFFKQGKAFSWGKN